MIYPVQTLSRLSVTFTGGGSPADPTTVTLTIITPDGAQHTVAQPPIVRDGIGAYHYDYTVATVGVHQYEFQGTGAVVAASGWREFIGT